VAVSCTVHVLSSPCLPAATAIQPTISSCKIQVRIFRSSPPRCRGTPSLHIPATTFTLCFLQVLFSERKIHEPRNFFDVPNRGHLAAIKTSRRDRSDMFSILWNASVNPLLPAKTAVCCGYENGSCRAGPELAHTLSPSLSRCRGLRNLLDSLLGNVFSPSVRFNTKTIAPRTELPHTG